MKIRAKYIGADTLGYVKGDKHELHFEIETWNCQDVIEIQDIVSESGAITRFRKGGFCEYHSLREFLDNWEVL